MTHSSHSLLRALSRSPLALKREALPGLLQRAALRRADMPDDGDGPDDPDMPGMQSTSPDVSDGILVLPIHGLIIPRADEMMGYCCECTPMDALMAAIDAAAADASVRAVVLDITSPGGTTWLVMEAAQKIRQLALLKPVRAVANAQAASAAYWLMTAAGKRYVTPSGEVGSVGVWSMHIDESKFLEQIGIDVTMIFAGQYKVDGNSFEPLSDSAREDMQHLVDVNYAQFTGAVADYMGVSRETVLADFGQGRCLLADDAKAAGMVDDIATMDQVLAALRAELDAPQPMGTEPRAALSTDLELRSIADAVTASDAGQVVGRAVPYRSSSQDLGGFREVFEAGAFAASIAAGDDMRVLWQHDEKCVFGRVSAGTATIAEQSDGVHYTATPPNAQWAKDAVESIRRKDVTQNSFGFRVNEPRKNNERWERRSDGIYRVITSATLVEVGPCTFPAYTDTSVATRSLQAARAENTIVDLTVPSAPSLDAYRDRMKAVAASL